MTVDEHLARISGTQFFDLVVDLLSHPAMNSQLHCRFRTKGRISVRMVIDGNLIELIDSRGKLEDAFKVNFSALNNQLISDRDLKGASLGEPRVKLSSRCHLNKH
jgi:hypothetical protein